MIISLMCRLVLERYLPRKNHSARYELVTTCSENLSRYFLWYELQPTANYGVNSQGWKTDYGLAKAARVNSTYQLDDGTARILVGMQLKQKAMQWFHSKPEHLEIPVGELIERMRNIFDHHSAKMELRRQFEKRIWRSDEIFSSYFYDKMIVANRVLDEGKLTDYIIDDIPDQITRDRVETDKRASKVLWKREIYWKHSRESNVLCDKQKSWAWE